MIMGLRNEKKYTIFNTQLINLVILWYFPHSASSQGESLSPNIRVYQTLRIWLGTQFSQPTPELGPLQVEF